MPDPTMRRRIWIRRSIIAAMALCAAISLMFVRYPLKKWQRLVGWTFTVEDRLRQFQSPVENRLRPLFGDAGIRFPGDELSLLCFKDTRIGELYAREHDGEWSLIKSYPILAASGHVGPKLLEGDRQVPEGIYRIESLNPNSHYHLSFRLDYPNDFDHRMAERDGRSNLGSDIMVHGRSSSVGCLAMGDPAIEELFVLAAITGPERVRVVICPTDFRKPGAEVYPIRPRWIAELYNQLKEAIQQCPPAPGTDG